MDMTVPAEVIEVPHIKELEEENELLLAQLHLVQEELEKYYLRNKELEKGQSAELQDNFTVIKGWVDDELINTLAENQRLQALVEVQQKIHQIETQNALNARLGNILIESVDSSGSLLSVPSKLRKIWKEENRQTPPELLGGSDFSKVIAAYGEGGFDAVEALIATASISPAMQASALTTLARYLMVGDLIQAAEAARRAYTLDPKPFRLKWLAFRLHEAGEVAEAEAMLAILPADTSFSDSETRHVSRLRSEAKNARQREAKQKTRYSEQRAEIDRQLRNLKRERDEQSKLVIERSRGIEKRDQDIQVLKQAQVQLEHEKQELVEWQKERKGQLAERDQEIRELKQIQAQLQQEKLELLNLQKEANVLLAERSHKVEKYIRDNQALEQVWAQLEQEKQELKVQQEESERRAAERDQEIGKLKQVQMQLEQEKAVLLQKNVEQRQLTEERMREIEALKQVQAQQQQILAQLEQEKQTLKAQQEESRKQSVERDGKIEELKQAQTQLTQEKAAQTKQGDEAKQLAAERLKRISELQQQIQSHQTSEAELVTRQQHMQEEMARAEAQLDLIKDMLLREPVL